MPISIGLIAAGSLFKTPAKALPINGADIYCVMREGGNDHNASWEAAYQNVKNGKREGLFKTSPRQAAAIIVEQVVQDRDKYEDCIAYLGDLYQSQGLPSDIEEELNEKEDGITLNDEKKTDKSKGAVVDNYDY